MVKGLFCFDMEGTLLCGETLNVAAQKAGCGEQVQEITSLAMEGKIDFKDAVRRRISLLAGMDVGEFTALVDSVPLVSGACEMIRFLKDKGHHVLLITGGMDVAAQIVAKKLGIDHWHSHKWKVLDGKLTTEVEFTYNDKLEILQSAKSALDPDFVVAIGDGANDLNMLRYADIGVAFKSKELLKDPAYGFLQMSSTDEFITYFEDPTSVPRLLGWHHHLRD